MDVSVAVEGYTDEGMASAILKACGLSASSFYGRHGKQTLLKKLAGYNAAAAFSPWFVLIDLDQDGPCPGGKRAEWLANPAALMCMRIAVREAEAWLLADSERIAQFLGVSAALISPSPEELDDPKATIVSLARRSRRREIREGLVPREGSGASVGPTYASNLRDFASSKWRPLVAAENAPSLKKCILRLQELAAMLEGRVR